MPPARPTATNNTWGDNPNAVSLSLAAAADVEQQASSNAGPPAAYRPPPQAVLVTRPPPEWAPPPADSKPTISPHPQPPPTPDDFVSGFASHPRYTTGSALSGTRTSRQPRSISHSFSLKRWSFKNTLRDSLTFSVTST